MYASGSWRTDRSRSAARPRTSVSSCLPTSPNGRSSSSRVGRSWIDEPLVRRLRSDREPPHAAALAVIVVDRAVLRATVVPDRQRAGRPPDTAGEFGPRLVRLKPFDGRAALVLGHVLEADGVAAADIQRLAPGLGMRARHGMLGFVLIGGVGVVDLHAADFLVPHAPPAAVLQPRAVDADEPVEQPAHAFGERVVGGASA